MLEYVSDLFVVGALFVLAIQKLFKYTNISALSENTISLNLALAMWTNM